jgi:hypothetical protein
MIAHIKMFQWGGTSFSISSNPTQDSSLFLFISYEFSEPLTSFSLHQRIDSTGHHALLTIRFGRPGADLTQSCEPSGTHGSSLCYVQDDRLLTFALCGRIVGVWGRPPVSQVNRLRIQPGFIRYFTHPAILIHHFRSVTG